MIKNYIFLGLPGVGKGTMATKLSAKKGLVHISTGEIFRKEIKKKTILGQKIKHLVENGKFVPDKITNVIIKKLLKKNQANGFVLDGYPRTISQAKFLKKNNFKIHVVILLETDKKNNLSRLFNRLGLRKDDNPKIVKKRLIIYHKKTKPLINWYKKEGILVNVDASNSIDKNFELLMKEIK